MWHWLNRMKLVILYGLLTATAIWLGREIGRVDMLGLNFPAAAFFIAPLVVLRDVIQEYNDRRKALIAILLGSMISYLLLDGSMNALYLATALFWSEVIDWGIYSQFRKFGWLVGMVVSDVIATPAVTLMFYWLARGTIELPYDQLIAKYGLVIVSYVLLFALRYHRRINYPVLRWGREVDANTNRA